MTSSPLRLRATLGFRRTDVPVVIARTRAICNGVAAAPATYPSPNPTPATLAAAADALDQSQQVAATRAKGSAAARNVKRDLLWTLLEVFLKYVQSLADANADRAVAIIQGAGLVVAKPSQHSKPLLKAALLAAGGSVALEANLKLLTAGRGKAKKTFFNWRYSPDGGKTWTVLPPTPFAKTTVTGLASLVTHLFEVSVTDRGGTSEWSPSTSLLTH